MTCPTLELLSVLWAIAGAIAGAASVGYVANRHVQHVKAAVMRAYDRGRLEGRMDAVCQEASRA